jgi:hypothetical protein
LAQKKLTHPQRGLKLELKEMYEMVPLEKIKQALRLASCGLW